MLLALAAFGCAGSAPPLASPRDGGELGASDASADPALVRCRRELALSDPECAQVRALALPPGLPPAAGNRYADDLAAARLGFLIFFDPRFASVPDVRCASCHLPERSFTDGKLVSEVILGAPLARNSQSILNAAWAGPFFFWDGRADSLWSQPLFALENAQEMAGSRLAIAHALFAEPIYRARYEALFGPLPELSERARFPERGKPGDPSFEAMAPADREAIDRVFANVGKVLEAYMRKLATGPSALDRYLAGEPEALEPAARAGLALFAQKGCITCHAGPALSDGAFHRPEFTSRDPGRAAAIATLRENPFNAHGPYADGDAGPYPTLPVQARAEDEGALRTPSLRNLALTGPYGHDGAFATIEALLAAPHGAPLDERERNDLTVFLLSLNGSYPARPWSDWPAR